MKYKEGIDFVVISHCRPKYIEMLVRSIHKYTKGVDYTINVVCNYVEKQREMNELKEMFINDETIKIFEGVDQSKTLVEYAHGGLYNTGEDYVMEIDGCTAAAGSYYAAEGLKIGIKAGNRENVCIMDADSIFLDEWVDKLLPLTEQYFFIANRWDPGDVFKSVVKDAKTEDGMARPMLWLQKRKHFEDNDLYPELTYRDTIGNITLFAQQNNLEFLCLENSYKDSFRPVRNDLIEQHVVKTKYGEQAFYDGKPIHFHYTKGAMREVQAYEDWIRLTEEYLENE